MDAAIFDYLDRARRIAERELALHPSEEAEELVMSIEGVLADAKEYQEGKRG